MGFEAEMKKNAASKAAREDGTKNAAKNKKENANIQANNEEEDTDTLSQSQVQQGVADTVWKVGCYKINPSTPSGQKFFILHMLVLPLIPITALVIQNSVTMNTLLGYQSRVKTIRNQVLTFSRPCCLMNLCLYHYCTNRFVVQWRSQCSFKTFKRRGQK